jgi:hypothetical protein
MAEEKKEEIRKETNWVHQFMVFIILASALPFGVAIILFLMGAFT